MREIKFRGKHLDKWLYGSLHMNESGQPAIATPSAFHFRCVDPDTVGQYTGLKDSEGREIYEGDVLRGHAGAAGVIESEVAFYAGAFRFSNNHLTLEYCLREIDNVKVIGNVYDNPSLLESKHDQ